MDRDTSQGEGASASAEPALAVPVEPASGLAPSGFDPSRSKTFRELKADVAKAREWPEVEWDDDGYPTAEEDDFNAWDGLKLDFHEAARFLLRELPAAAENCCASCEVTDSVEELFKDEPVKRIEFSTGGWSGAESLLGFISSRFDTRHFMLSWRRGGHYVFEIPLHFLVRDSDAALRRPEGAEAEGQQRGPSGIAQPPVEPPPESNHV